MSAEEAALLAAECPRPTSLNRAWVLAGLFRKASGSMLIIIAFNKSLSERDADYINLFFGIFKRHWSTFSIYQREEILVAWAKEVLS